MRTFETDSPDERRDAETADAAMREYLRRGGVSSYAAAETLQMLKDRLRAFEEATREFLEAWDGDGELSVNRAVAAKDRLRGLLADL